MRVLYTRDGFEQRSSVHPVFDIVQRERDPYPIDAFDLQNSSIAIEDNTWPDNLRDYKCVQMHPDDRTSLNERN
jgi:hypothetical protein